MARSGRRSRYRAESEVVIAALDSLEFVGDSSIIPELTPLLKHPDPDVQEAAASAIEFLSD